MRNGRDSRGKRLDCALSVDACLIWRSDELSAAPALARVWAHSCVQLMSASILEAYLVHDVVFPLPCSPTNMITLGFPFFGW